ncbi:DUF4870 domain-containing protein [Methanolobus bombayensis]|uniref:DUF4870 domain-containing protein n=1 Tax=Methanolobus bombayensis TaxID=38023 RepID=UPI001AE3AF97|nr:DUF4870 domain-containing protein [Methanolobus bombayensis]MBP1908213.1 putative membrane protein [Methanolobus bombayensis]
MSETNLGVSENIAGLIAYVLGFITGILLLVIEKENQFVRFHAAQSTVLFGAVFILNIVLGFIPFLGWLIAFVLSMVALVLWLLLMFKAFNGEIYRVPMVADYADKLEVMF